MLPEHHRTGSAYSFLLLWLLDPARQHRSATGTIPRPFRHALVVQGTTLLQIRRQERRFDLIRLFFKIPENLPLQRNLFIRWYPLIQLLLKYLPQTLPRLGTRATRLH
jgi:hypothetical protein